MSTPYVTIPTERVFIDLPTTGGTTVIEYTNGGNNSSYIYYTHGSLGHTIQLPPPVFYSLQIGTRFEFMNTSSGTITVNADDGSNVMSVLPNSVKVATLIGQGNTSASWSSLGSGSTFSGVLPIANGGTGSSTLHEDPVVSTIMNWDEVGCAHANNFIGSIALNPASTTYTNANLPTTVMVTSGSSLQYFLPNESSVYVGRTVTFINKSSNSFLVYDAQGDSHKVDPGMGVTYVNTNASGAAASWIARSFWCSQFGESLRTPNQGGCNMLVCSGSGQSTTMNNTFQLNTLISGTNQLYIIRLPDVSTITIGTAYVFFVPYATTTFTIPSVQINSSDNTTLITIGSSGGFLAANRCVCTCTANSGSGHAPWNVTYGTNS